MRSYSSSWAWCLSKSYCIQNQGEKSYTTIFLFIHEKSWTRHLSCIVLGQNQPLWSESSLQQNGPDKIANFIWINVFHLDFFWTTLGQTYRYDASLATDTNDVADDIPPWWSSSTSFRIVIHEPIKRRTGTTSTKTLLLKQVEIIADSGKDSSVLG